MTTMTEQKTILESCQKQGVTEMEGKPRKTGIDIIGDVPWGTHLCHFYQTKEDLIDILVPYFKAGLEGNEFCMWVTSAPLDEEEAKEAMRKAVPNFDRYLKGGQIEIVPHTEWYLKDSSFDLQRVLNAWIDKLNQALAKGYDGIRVTGNTAWLEKKDRADFADYEEEVNNSIGKYRILAICSYSLDRCGASEIIDVVNNHQFAIIRREGKWERIESAQHKRAEEVLSETTARLQVLQQVMAAVHSTLDLEKVFRQITDAAIYSLGYTTALILTLNDEKRCFEIETLSTKERFLQQIDKILGFSLRTLSIPADTETNAVIGSVMNDRVVVAKTLAEIVHPLIGKKTCSALQKLARTKNYIVVPLPSKTEGDTEGDVVGALFISSPREEISEEELTTIQDFAHAASQAIRNANLHTQTKRAEEALRQSEENLRTYLESAPDGVYINDLKGTFLYGNKKAEEITGYKRKELIGKSFLKLNLLPPKHLAKAGKLLALNVMGRPTGPDELELIRKDGSRMWTEINTTPIKQEGEVVVIGFVRDITERKQAEERERQLQQELNLASRLASIGEMASGIAHEINNPLTSVIGFSQLLMGKDIPDDIRDDIKVINSEAQRVARIVGGLLAFARQHKPGREYVDINDIISAVLKLRSYEMKANNIQVVTQLALDLPQTVANAGQLQQVFLNIILNAEKEMTRAHNRGKLLVKTEKMGDSIRVSFVDDGPGISQENLDKIFNPFFTTREVGDGTGLGLSICHGIIAAHNGRIYAKSELGKGATFVVELPIVANIELTEKAEVIEEKPQKQVKAKILAVDDETAILQFLKRLLTEAGYDVETTDKAHVALERLHSAKYDLVLLDVKMPVVSGIELYRQIEAIDPALAQRVMFITGDVMETTTRDFLDKTKAYHITKPFNIERLKKEMNHILTKALERQQALERVA